MSIRFRSAFLFLAVVAACSMLSAQSVRSLFIPENLEWKDSPVAAGLEVAENAEIFVFASDHNYAYVSGVMYRDKGTGKVSLCSGCGFSTNKGSWSTPAASQVEVRFHLTHSDIRRSGKRKWMRERWDLEAASSPLKAKGLQTSKEPLVLFTSLSNPEVLAGMLHDDN
jgi:hypothetical protein